MRRLSAVPCTALAVALTLASIPLRAADADFKSLDPKAISIRLPADIDWKSSPGGVGNRDARRRRIEAGAVRDTGQVEGSSQQPPALSSQR